MTYMNGNPHVHAAKEELRRTSADAGAQALAILALAFEQRTANLIAIATMNPQWYGSTSREAFDQIDTRLGLTGGN